MPEDRRLAAIMFTDIVGYTSLMGSDENKAFTVLRKNREIQRPIIKKYRGEWLKEMGDGILASFHTASDAVRCAGEIQQAVKKEGIDLRIGIHEGEVVFEDEDVFGDGVNIASRLEPLAPVGGIYVSESVFRNIQNKKGIEANFVREETLKNVKHPVKIYEVKVERGEKRIESQEEKKVRSKLPYILVGVVIVIIAVFLIWKYLPKQPTVELEKSIAILLFKDLSEDQNKQYIADGVMDAITGHLSKIEGLRVTPRTSMEQYRKTTKTASIIGAELDVSYLIEGSFLMINNQVRLTIQLVIAEEEDHLLYKEYDRDWSEIFNVQSEVAQAIANEVEVVITPEVKERIESIPTTIRLFSDIFKGVSRNPKGDAEKKGGLKVHMLINTIKAIIVRANMYDLIRKRIIPQECRDYKVVNFKNYMYLFPNPKK